MQAVKFPYSDLLGLVVWRRDAALRYCHGSRDETPPELAGETPALPRFKLSKSILARVL